MLMLAILIPTAVGEAAFVRPRALRVYVNGRRAVGGSAS